MQIVDIMTPCPYKITSDKSVAEAMKIMELRNISHLPVSKEEEIIGVVTKRDLEIATLLAEAGKIAANLEAVCKDEPYFVESSTPLKEVTAAMADKQTDYALVTDEDGNLSGIFTVTDACKVVTLLLNEIE